MRGDRRVQGAVSFRSTPSQRWLQLLRLNRWLRARQVPTRKRLRIEIVALAVIVTLIAVWLSVGEANCFGLSG